LTVKQVTTNEFIDRFTDELQNVISLIFETS